MDKRLIEKHHFSQVIAAKRLEANQASISHYIYSKRGDKRLKQLEASPFVRGIVVEISKDIADEKLSSSRPCYSFASYARALEPET